MFCQQKNDWIMKCNAKIFLTAAAAVALMAGGCKTTEANYRSAYEKALEKRNEGLSADDRCTTMRMLHRRTAILSDMKVSVTALKCYARCSPLILTEW